MEALLAILAAILGYLVGSISFARIVVSLHSPGQTISTISHRLEGSSTEFQSSALSATSVRHQLGTRFGCLAAVLDILKGALPTLMMKYWQPDAPYYLLTALMTTVGHNYPIYYRFKGGRGLSTIMGGFMVLDWLGVLITNTVGVIIGGFLGQVVLMRWAGLLLMLPWIWLRTHDVAKLSYVLLANVVFWIAMIPDLRQFISLKQSGQIPNEQEVADFMGMGSVYRFIERYNVVRLLKKRRNNR